MNTDTLSIAIKGSLSINDADLRSAAEEIFRDSAASVDALKNRPWYKTLFNALTFYRGDKKLILKDIRNLANLQTIFMQMYVNNCNECSSVLADVMESICQTQSSIQKLYDRCYLRLEEQENVKKLDEADQRVLYLLLQVYADGDCELSEENEAVFQEYNRAVADGLEKASGRLTKEQLRCVEKPDVLYRCILEQHVVISGETCEDGIPNNLKIYLDELNLGPAKRREIQETVQRELNTYGRTYFCTKYNSASIEWEWSGDAPEFLEVSSDEPTIDSNATVPEAQEITIDSIVHISEGQVQVYRNAIVHMGARILCEGELRFENCEIHYNESAGADEIKVEKTGSLSMQCCTVVCHGCDTHPFIDASMSSAVVTFTKCKFINCCYYVRAQSSLFKACRIIKPGSGFLRPSFPHGSGLFDTCQIGLGDLPSSIAGIKYDPIFEETGIELLKCHIQGVYSESAVPNLIEAETLSIKHCGFENINAGIIFYDLKAERSTFIECVPVAGSFLCTGMGGGKIEDCRFDECSHILHKGGEKKLEIRACQFNKCWNHIVMANCGSNISVTSCDFNDWHANMNVLHKESFFETRKNRRSDSMLNLSRTASKKDFPNIISMCTFRNADCMSCYLVRSSIIGKPCGIVTEVSDCNFINCTTARADMNLFNTFDHYYAKPFNKRREVKVINILQGCRGLDCTKQRMYASDNDSAVSLLTMVGGEPIGAPLEASEDTAIGANLSETTKML